MEKQLHTESDRLLERAFELGWTSGHGGFYNGNPLTREQLIQRMRDLEQEPQRRFTLTQIEDYIRGWMSADAAPEVLAALKNAFTNLRDDQDGIAVSGSEPLITHATVVTTCRACGVTGHHVLDIPDGMPFADAEVAAHHEIDSNGWIDGKCPACVARTLPVSAYPRELLREAICCNLPPDLYRRILNYLNA